MTTHPTDEQSLTVPRILESINRIQTLYIDESQPQVVFGQLLQELLVITGSTSGFIGEMVADGAGGNRLAIQAMTNMSVSETGNAGVELPIFHESGSQRKMIGLVGLSCREGGYDQHCFDMLQPLLATCGHLIDGFHNKRQRALVESELQASKERFEILVHGINDAIWDSDIVADRHYVSSRWKEMLGYQDHELEFSVAEWESRLHPKDRDRILNWWGGMISGDATRFEQKYRLRHRDGSYRWLYCRGILVRDEHGKLVRVAGMNSDITTRKQVEADRKKLQHQLYQAQKMELVGKLAGGIAHDFNNVLSAIMGHAEMALRALGTDSAEAEHLVEIRKAAERSAAMTRRLLGFAKGQPVMPMQLDVNEAVRDLLTLLEQLIGDHIRLDWQLADALAPVWMDRTELDQIMTNLCVNARDAIGAQGVISIRTRNVVLDDMFQPRNVQPSECEYVLISVTDDGNGMEQALIPKIFDSFFTTKAEGQGTGLGLATVYGIVTQHQGFIEVNSEEGRGTTFEIYLPCHRANGERSVRQPQLRLVRNEQPGAQRRSRVLVVEDDPVVLRMSARMLKSLDYDVVTAPTPLEALDLAREHEFDLLVTDVVMPEMSGIELANQLQRLQPRVKVLYISGYPAHVVAGSGLGRNVDNFLHKPFSVDDLAARLERLG